MLIMQHNAVLYLSIWVFHHWYAILIRLLVLACLCLSYILSVIMSCNNDDDHCSLFKYEMIVNITPATVSPLILLQYLNLDSIDPTSKKERHCTLYQHVLYYCTYNSASLTCTVYTAYTVQYIPQRLYVLCTFPC